MTEFPDHTTSTPTSNDLSPLDSTRRNLLALGAIAGAAALVLPALPARALDSGLGGLAAPLKFLEAAQYFQGQFFSRALQSGSIDGLAPADGKALLTIANQDNEQARWINAVRMQRGMTQGRANLPSSLTEPNFTVASAYGTRSKFFDSALAIKAASVGAFHGIVGKGGTAEMVQAVAALAGVQNRHLAVLREMAGVDPFDTYVTAISLQEASKTLGKYGFNMKDAI